MCTVAASSEVPATLAPRPTALARALRGVADALDSPASRGGAWCFGDVPLPLLCVPSAAPFDPAPPWSDAQLSRLRAAGAHAAFGLGGDTVVDASVRDGLSLSPPDFALDNADELCSAVAALASGGLRGGEACAATLQKLHVYAPGGAFAAHVDTPAVPTERHVGSAVVMLPSCSPFSGGALDLLHAGDSTLFDAACAPPSTTTAPCAVFCPDVEHEVEQIESGVRVALTFALHSLPAAPDGAAHRPPEADPALARALDTLKRCPKRPPFVGVLTSHRYSAWAVGRPGGCALKGADRALRASLEAASSRERVRLVAVELRIDACGPDDRGACGLEGPHGWRRGTGSDRVTARRGGGAGAAARRCSWLRPARRPPAVALPAAAAVGSRVPPRLVEGSAPLPVGGGAHPRHRQRGLRLPSHVRGHRVCSGSAGSTRRQGVRRAVRALLDGPHTTGGAPGTCFCGFVCVLWADAVFSTRTAGRDGIKRVGRAGAQTHETTTGE